MIFLKHTFLKLPNLQRLMRSLPFSEDEGGLLSLAAFSSSGVALTNLWMGRASKNSWARKNENSFGTWSSRWWKVNFENPFSFFSCRALILGLVSTKCTPIDGRSSGTSLAKTLRMSDIKAPDPGPSQVCSLTHFNSDNCLQQTLIPLQANQINFYKKNSNGGHTGP